VNTFGNKIKVGKDKFHPVHEYCDSLKNIYQDDFKNSIPSRLSLFRAGEGGGVISLLVLLPSAQIMHSVLHNCEQITAQALTSYKVTSNYG
jgi:hypothetical protein